MTKDTFKQFVNKDGYAKGGVPVVRGMVGGFRTKRRAASAEAERRESERVRRHSWQQAKLACGLRVCGGLPPQRGVLGGAPPQPRACQNRRVNVFTDLGAPRLVRSAQVALRSRVPHPSTLAALGPLREDLSDTELTFSVPRPCV